MDIVQIKRNIRNAVSTYFSGLVMTKCLQKGQYALYYAKYASNLARDDRFVIAVVSNDSQNLGFETYLHNLTWDSFQTRTLLEPPVIGLPERSCEHIVIELIKSKIHRTETNERCSVYSANNLPVKIELELTQICNDDICTIDPSMEYPETGTIISALITFNCIISFTL